MARDMIDKLKKLVDEYNGLQEQLMSPGTAQNPSELKRIGQRLSQLESAKGLYEEYLEIDSALRDSQEILKTETDPEMKKFAQDELEQAEAKMPTLMEKVRLEPRLRCRLHTKISVYLLIDTQTARHLWRGIDLPPAFSPRIFFL